MQDGSPIRDIGSIWDMEILGHFLKRRDLESFANESLAYYCSHLTGQRQYTFLDPEFLNEASGIAHSAFLLLSLLLSTYAGGKQHIRAIADGIVKQQRQDGSYKIYFGDKEDDGLELYPGEAMLALLEAFKGTKDMRYLESVEKGFLFYKSEYYEKGRVEPGTEVFFANWQSQYCRLLFELTGKEELQNMVRGYVLGLHDAIIESGFYRRVARQPRSESSVEVACALEGLGDAFFIAAALRDRRLDEFRDGIHVALSYLFAVQCTEDCTAREKGGFRFSLIDRLQRIDVTGHAASGFIKSINTGVV